MQSQLRYSIYIWPSKFFRIRLLALSNSEIEGLLKDYDNNVRTIKQNVARIAWYMRGGVTMSELYAMAQSDFVYFNEVIEDNFELSKKAKQIIL